MKTFELLLWMMLGTESTIELFKKDSKYYSHRGKSGEQEYVVNSVSMFPKPLQRRVERMS